MLMKWISSNWLALYGAIVGTIALFINFSRLIHSVQRDKVKVDITTSAHRRASQNIIQMNASQDGEPAQRIKKAEIYLVTIRNTGNVDAYIEDVGMICSKRISHSASVYSGSGFQTVAEAKQGPIKPKASREFKVYLPANQEPFTATHAFAIDSTGKQWKKKA